MRNAILVSILATVLAVGAAAVYAGPPVNGTYKSTSGQFDEGTATSTWLGGDYLTAGNVIYGRSTAGGVFTNDWTINCPMVISVFPLDGPLGANGNYSFYITYAGGYVTLGGPGNPWDGGDAVYTGTITNYYEIRTVQTANGLITGAVSDHAIEATIQNYSESCVAWAIGNGALIGGTPPGLPLPFLYGPGLLQSVKGPGYPDFPNGACALLPAGPGHWEDVRDLTLTVKGCIVATQPSTWGNVKSMYRN